MCFGFNIVRRIVTDDKEADGMRPVERFELEYKIFSSSLSFREMMPNEIRWTSRGVMYFRNLTRGYGR